MWEQICKGRRQSPVSRIRRGSRPAAQLIEADDGRIYRDAHHAPFAYQGSFASTQSAAPSLACLSRHPGRRCAGNRAEELACAGPRSEEHTSELQSLMRISYAVFCMKKKINNKY